MTALLLMKTFPGAAEKLRLPLIFVALWGM